MDLKKLTKRKDINRIIKELKLDRLVTNEEIASAKKHRAIVFFIVSAIFLINAICNYVFYNGKLMIFYAIILGCFLVGITILLLSDKIFIADSIVSATMVVGLIYLILQGRLVGYDILWTFAIPTLWVLAVDFRIAGLTNITLSIFYLIIFLSPLNTKFFGTYTNRFMSRFPFTYLIVFIVTSILQHRSMMASSQLTIKTYYDSLTGLCNRAYYNRATANIKREDYKNISIVSLDVNCLKAANDNYGHDKGDTLIVNAAKAIKKAFKNAEIVCRIGGDEFVVLTYEDKESFAESYNSLEECCKEFYDDDLGELSISKGCAFARNHLAATVEQLYTIADQEMYKNKNEFHNRKQ